MNIIMQNRLPSAADRITPARVAPTTVLVPMLNLSLAPDMLQLAALLAVGFSSPTGSQDLSPDHPKPHVIVLGVVEVPEDQPLSTGLDMARSYRALLHFLPSEVEAGGRQVRVEAMVKVARDVASAVRQAAIDEQAGLALFYWKGYSSKPKRYSYGRTLDAVLSNPPCDVALVRPEGWRNSRRILLPVRGGASAEHALDLALSLAEQSSLPLIVMHNVQTTASKDPDETKASQSNELGEEPYLVFTEHLEAVKKSVSVPVLSLLTLGDDPASALLQEAEHDDLIVMGMAAPNTDRTHHNDPDTSVPVIVSREKGAPLLLLRIAEPVDVAGYTRKGRSRRAKKSWEDMPFERWFVENTYNGDEFKDPDEFLKLKKASGHTLSVALLTLNDAKHIHSVITGLERVLVQLHPIADQIAVIDAGSSDNTVEIARSLGVEVYSTLDILPEQGQLHGRGERWWKSLAVLRGDIIVWLDPHAKRFHPTTAMSLAGPLLQVPALQMVKAFGDTHAEANGVNGNGSSNGEKHHTELDEWALDVNWGGAMMPRREDGMLARHIRVQALTPADLAELSASQIAVLPPHTILQVLYPSLAGVISPFGHDTAGRREAMRSAPAFMGDNLEAGLLMSIAAQYGTQAIAQVELRHARPAPPPQPSFHNAIETLQAISRRLPDSEMRQLAADIARRLEHEMEGPNITSEGNVEVRALPLIERPPIASVLSSE